MEKDDYRKQIGQMWMEFIDTHGDSDSEEAHSTYRSNLESVQESVKRFAASYPETGAMSMTIKTIPSLIELQLGKKKIPVDKRMSGIALTALVAHMSGLPNPLSKEEFQTTDFFRSYDSMSEKSTAAVKPMVEILLSA